MQEKNKTFDPEKYKKKIKAILEFELSMGLVKNPRQFAIKYKISQSSLIGYLKHGHLNVFFAGDLCKEHNLSADYLIYDIKPTSRPKLEFLPPLVLPEISEE